MKERYTVTTIGNTKVDSGTLGVCAEAVVFAVRKGFPATIWLGVHGVRFEVDQVGLTHRHVHVAGGPCEWQEWRNGAIDAVSERYDRPEEAIEPRAGRL